ncbi:MAG: 4-hydroxythreonine-4-phosphate dehydrogenase PdxA [Armatimonadota bacterium]|nr:4-hydroxythreonine-4-phosphate dehydrogenase PdxA [Armatimonadota bacterium]
MVTPLVRLAVTVGDPSGIGPEVLAKALLPPLPCRLVVVGDREVWDDAQRVSTVRVPALPATRPGLYGPAGVPMREVPVPDRSWGAGAVSAAAGHAAVTWLEDAVRLALAGEADAVVFAPLNKQAIRLAGYAVRDEYELCAALAGVTDYDEVNAIPHPAEPDGALLWVARATSHVPLRDVASTLTVARVARAIRRAHAVARAAGASVPRIGVAALNPHAGEGGTLGDEEVRIIRPAIEETAADGIQASGPHPSDHIFRLARSGRFDAVVTMYHDQAQIATKLLGFEHGVSVGVGFPFVMTTPSHGTAFDIVGAGTADPRPMRAALALAVRLATAGVARRLADGSPS